MQATDFDSALLEAVSEVLESMYFMSVTGPLELAPAVDADWVTVGMQFKGESSGEFGLRAPTKTAQAIASNFLGGDEPELHPSRIADVFGELCNMVCGAFLSRVESGSIHDLSHPEPPLEASLPPHCSASMWLELDEGPLQVWMKLETPL
jgi:CheY-specific phosphatase CheX